MSDYIENLCQGLEPHPENNVFEDIWGEYEKTVLHSIVTTFGLDFIVDQSGGDVDTVRGVGENGTFKNPIYEKKYNERGDYDATKYHNAPAYKNITAEERKKFNETGQPTLDTYVKGNRLYFNKGDGPWHRASLDHVISAHEIHDDPVRMLADIDGVELANDPNNLRYTNQALNSRMSDYSIEEYISKSERAPEKTNWMGNKGEPLPEDVKNRLREEDEKARNNYKSAISKSYYTGPQFYADMTNAAVHRGLEMGLRQVFGFIFIEIWYSCKKELNCVTPGNDMNECLDAIVRGVKNGVNSAKKKYKKMISQMEQGFAAGALGSLTTTICNIFVNTEKNVVCYIRQAYAAIVQAGNILLVNPNDLLIGEQIRMATVVLGSGASAIAGLYVGDIIAKSPMGMLPEVGPLIVRFVSILVGGLLSCTFLIMLDRSKLINDLVGKMNQYTTKERKMNQISRAFKEIVAELENYNIDEFIDECDKYSIIGNIIGNAADKDELDRLLEIIYSTYEIKDPWEGDFDEFMGNEENYLVFD